MDQSRAQVVGLVARWLKGLPGRAYYALDLTVGLMGGERCPNCGTPGHRNVGVLRRFGGVLRIFRCSHCALLYRPVGFRGGLLPRLYYSYLYRAAGVATARGLERHPEEFALQMRSEGKDRTPLVDIVLAGRRPARVCVLGCSWGYEMIPLRASGLDAFGIEIGSVRREYGRRALGLNIYSSIEEAANKERPAEVLLSSHVLEHIPGPTAILEAVTERLKPAVQIHITPCVEATGADPGSERLVGREHPVGVTLAFWQSVAPRLGMSAEVLIAGAVPRSACGETIAILRR